MSSSGGGDGVKSDINVTPLVDVVLVLLIIFMVVTPELQRGKEVALPSATSAKARQEGGDPIVVTVKSDLSIYIEQDQVPSDRLSDRVRDILDVTPNRSVLLKGDHQLRYGEVKTLINNVRKGGAKDVSLAAAVPEAAK